MANFARIRPPGFWVQGSVVDPQEFEDLDAIRTKLINADGGSAHAPAAPIVIGGSGMQLTGPVQLAGAVTMPTGASLQQAAGAPWGLQGPVTFGNPSVISFDNGTLTAWNSGSAASIGVDSTWTIYGDVTWQNFNWPKVTSRMVVRRRWRIASVTYDGTPPASPRSWVQSATDLLSPSPCLQTSDATATHQTRLELLDLPIGATLNSVTVRTRGTSGTSGMVFPNYDLVRWRSSDGISTLSAMTDDVHNDTNWTSILHTPILATTNNVIDSDYHYGVTIFAPSQASTGASMRVYDVIAILTVQSIQL